MTEKKASWYSTGSKGVEQERARREAAMKPRRMWLKQGSSAKLIFLHDEPFNINEYQWFMNSSWQNWATMSEETAVDTLFREKGMNPSFTSMWTVVNCTSWIDKQDKEHNHVLQYLPAKETIAEQILRRRDKQGGLKGRLFEATRNEGGKTSNIGDDYQFEKDVDLDKVLEYANWNNQKFIDMVNQGNEDEGKAAFVKSKFQVEVTDGKIGSVLVPFNYFDLLAPPSEKEARLLLAGVKSGGRGGSSGGAGEDEIPF